MGAQGLRDLLGFGQRLNEHQNRMRPMKTFSPKANNQCFGCGADNPLGLKLTFSGDREDACVSAEFQPLPFMAGGSGMMHGGFIALLLDEASTKVLSLFDRQGVTRNIEVSFEKPVSLDRPIRIEAKLLKQERREHSIEARILNSRGDVLAKSEALFLAFTMRRPAD